MARGSCQKRPGDVIVAAIMVSNHAVRTKARKGIGGTMFGLTAHDNDVILALILAAAVVVYLRGIHIELRRLNETVAALSLNVLSIKDR